MTALKRMVRIAMFSYSVWGTNLTSTIYIKVGISNETEIASGTAKVKIVAGNIVKYVDCAALAGKGYRSVQISIDAKSLGTSTKTITAYVDYLNQITEADETNNTVSQTITISDNSGYSDLAFYIPSGWDDKLVISTQTGTYSDSNTFTTDDNIYLDFTVKNQGSIFTTSSVYVDIYVDDVKVDYWFCSAGLNSDAT